MVPHYICFDFNDSGAGAYSGTLKAFSVYGRRAWTGEIFNLFIKYISCHILAFWCAPFSSSLPFCPIFVGVAGFFFQTIRSEDETFFSCMPCYDCYAINFVNGKKARNFAIGT
jgi:hypothetical protein